MIRRNIDLLAMLVLLAGVGFISQARCAMESLPVTVQASIDGQRCPLMKVFTVLPAFRLSR